MAEVPDCVRAAFSGTDLPRLLGQAYLLVTVDSDGRPRPCVLSAGEVLSLGPETLRLGLWHGTTTSGNLLRGSPALFCYLAGDGTHYLAGPARPLDADPTARLDCFDLVVESVRTDAHPGMPVTAPVTFGVDGDPAEVLDMWANQLRVLRAATPR